VTDEGRARQQALHEAVEVAVADELEEGRVLTGWVIVWETVGLGEGVASSAGHLYGPHEMTTWRALGLLEWARRFNLIPDDDETGNDRDA
jgi:hypothetical protein